MSIHDILSRINPTTRASSVQGEGPEIVEFNEEGHIVRRTFLDKLFLSLVIILVALGSFGLGKLSRGGEREPVRIEYDASIPDQNSNDQFSNTGGVANAAGQGVVASKNGSKYHYEYCPGAKQISEKNKILFASAEAAEQAGYTLAGNCQPR